MGRPAALSDVDCDTQLPDENILPPGDYTPHDYLSTSVNLAQISGHIFQGMYSAPKPGSDGKISRRTIADLYSELVRWRHDLPSHLRTGVASTMTSHMRSVAFLDLRFQHAVVLVTRPLLLRYVSAKMDNTLPNLTRDTVAFLVAYSDACAQAGRSSYNTLRFMANRNLLNNVLWVDSFYILSTAMVLLLEYLRKNDATSAEQVRQCVGIMKALNPHGVGRYVLQGLLDVTGTLNLDSNTGGDKTMYTYVKQEPTTQNRSSVFQFSQQPASFPSPDVQQLSPVSRLRELFSTSPYALL